MPFVIPRVEFTGLIAAMATASIHSANESIHSTTQSMPSRNESMVSVESIDAFGE
jgi:hypothetical protein